MLIVDDDGRTIKIHKGDTGILCYMLDDNPNFSFEIGDKIELVVFEKKGYTKDILFSKEITVTEETEYVDIEILKEDTETVEQSNNIITYWYNIYLNGTIANGYDEEEGPAEFKILPAKEG